MNAGRASAVVNSGMRTKCDAQPHGSPAACAPHPSAGQQGRRRSTSFSSNHQCTTKMYQCTRMYDIPVHPCTKSIQGAASHSRNFLMEMGKKYREGRISATTSWISLWCHSRILSTKSVPSKTGDAFWAQNASQ